MLEHSTATFYITGISRSVTHELIRHRHFSFSQLSQRYLPAAGPEVVEPAVIAADPELHEIFTAAVAQSAAAYAALLAALEERAATAPDGTLARKQARQAARAVLPNATSTAIVVTGNYRAWRHFIGMRATEAADVDIRGLAVGAAAGAAGVGAQRLRRFPGQRAGRTAPRSPRRRWSARADRAGLFLVRSGQVRSVVLQPTSMEVMLNGVPCWQVVIMSSSNVPVTSTTDPAGVATVSMPIRLASTVPS